MCLIMLLINTAGYHKEDAWQAAIMKELYFCCNNNDQLEAKSPMFVHIKIHPFNTDDRFHTVPLGEVGLIPM